jgi:hypothetical protein
VLTIVAGMRRSLLSRSFTSGCCELLVVPAFSAFILSVFLSKQPEENKKEEKQ